LHLIRFNGTLAPPFTHDAKLRALVGSPQPQEASSKSELGD